MNLAFLNPCRQPDRIDSTLTIPQVLHPPRRPSLSTTTTTTTTATSSSGKTAATAITTGQQQRRRRQRHRRLSAASSCTSTSTSTMTSGRRDDDNEEEEEDSERGKEVSMDDVVGNGDVDNDEYALDNIDQNYNTTTANTNLEEEEEDDDEEDDDESCYWTACYAVSFHRRGNFLVSGHASGLVTVHDFLGRNLCALYWPPPPIALSDKETTTQQQQKMNACAILKSFYFGTNDGSGDSDQRQLLGEKTRKDNKTNKKIGKMLSTRKGKQPLKTTEKSSSSGEEESTSNNDKSSTVATTSSSDYYDENNDSSSSMENHYQQQQQQQLVYRNGVTSVCWDRYGKTLLAGAIGDMNLRLMDNTHPLVATDCTDAVQRKFFASNNGGCASKKNPKFKDDDHHHHHHHHGETTSALEIKKASVIAKCPPLIATLSDDNSKEEGKHESIAIRMDTVSLGRARLLRSKIIGNVKTGISSTDSRSAYSVTPILSSSMTATPCTTSVEKVMIVPTRRHPTLVLQLPHPLGGPAQLHPRESHVGLACMMDGSLALFYLPPMAYYEALPSLLLNGDTSEDDIPSKMVVDDNNNNDDDNDDENKQKQWAIDALIEIERKRAGNLVFLVPPPSPESDKVPQYFITCATFGKDGDIVWAVTKCGTLLAFRIDPSMMNQLRGDDKDNASTPIMQPTLCVNIPGGTAAYQIIVSRNGKLLLINSADCSLRLYSVDDLREKFDVGGIGVSRENESDEKSTNITNVSPLFVFQDSISKAPWASCDFSGDGEFVVGGCNSYPQPGDNYKLVLWNCVTGELVDRLTGPISSLYSVSCHPTRPFIAVGTSDDLIDVWGSQIDWVPFAPDFQALQRNELYEEREDEFDVVDDVEECTDGKLSSASNHISSETENVDIMTIEKIPAYSDSEDETPVFYFDTKVVKILSE